jgi:glutamine---fructose-6-phosphate transaminase (isomerizing)
MCGIIGIVGKTQVAPRLLEGLKRLEYRGYDSAGIATLVNGHIERRRAEGKLVNLEVAVAANPLVGTTGMGHTRWATHGAPTETNAHPLSNGRVAVVHNGIIENFQALKSELSGLGYQFETQTDTEVVVHLLTRYLDEQKPPRAAVELAIGRLEGAFALVILFAGRSDLMYGVRHGAPLAVGYGEGETYVGSDALALAHLTQKIAYLEEGDWVEATPKGARICERSGAPAKRRVTLVSVSSAVAGKGGYRHYMHKEIHEQPAVIGDTLNAYINPATREVLLPKLPFDWRRLPRLAVTACGTAFYAGLLAKHWFERYARLPVDADIASELRYRAPPLAEGGATLVVSQSGETADTLAALRYAKQEGQATLAIVNVPESTIAREAHVVLPTHAGTEIGVASTKAFTTQLAVLACLAIEAARVRGRISAEEARAKLTALTELPSRIAEFLAHEDRVIEIAKRIAEARDVLYLGRGTSYPIALEGALKLKEISYIHAEGYAAGEMKHGPIALIDEATPVIGLAPSDELFEKTASNLQEAAARGGRIIVIGDADGLARLRSIAFAEIEVPKVDPFVAPLLYAVPVQLLAYHAAVLKGTDVDQPRNLAKSVTVE